MAKTSERVEYSGYGGRKCLVFERAKQSHLEKHEWMLFRIRVRVRVYEIRAEKTESEHPTTIWLNKENKKMPQLQFGTLCSLPFVHRNEYLCVCEWCLLSTLFGLVSEFKEVSLFPVLSLPVFFGLAFNRVVVHLLKMFWQNEWSESFLGA